MEDQVLVDWGSDSRSDGRLLLGTHANPPLLSPVSKHRTGHFVLVAIIVVIMVIAVGAIFCLCFLWEGQLRQQSRFAGAGQFQHADGGRLDASGGTGSNPTFGASSLSIVMPGDDVPRYVAWVSPYGPSVNPVHTQFLPALHPPSPRKSSPSPAAALQLCIRS